MSRRLLSHSWVVAALGAAAYLLLDPPSADLAAQEYRAGLVRSAGLGIWDNGWYAGHHTPAYSIFFPPLGAALGVGLAGRWRPSRRRRCSRGWRGATGRRRWRPARRCGSRWRASRRC